MIIRSPQPDPEFKRKFNELETIKEMPVLPKMSYGNTSDMWTPPPYWQNLLQEDKKIEIRGFRLIVVGFALFGVVVALIFFWKIVMAVLAMRIILS
jgi:hypothetical protein